MLFIYVQSMNANFFLAFPDKPDNNIPGKRASHL
jgi:hypothetical protein